jgi:type II secretory pathway pseudopilin PulG
MKGICRLIQDSRGISIVEVLIAAMLLGIASAGVTLMFGSGQALIIGEGDNRVALALARQAVEQVRASGFGPATGSDPREELTFNSTAYGTTHPGYERTVAITSVCANNFLPACSPPTPIEAKLITVTVRATGGVKGTDVAASPVILRSVMVAK